MARAIDVVQVKAEIAAEKLAVIIENGSVLLKDMQSGEAVKIATLTTPNEPLSVFVQDDPDREYIDYICPGCKDTISQRRRGQLMSAVYQCRYHDGCGQRIDWGNPIPYRRPPEGEEEP